MYASFVFTEDRVDMGRSDWLLSPYTLTGASRTASRVLICTRSVVGAGDPDLSVDGGAGSGGVSETFRFPFFSPVSSTPGDPQPTGHPSRWCPANGRLRYLPAGHLGRYPEAGHTIFPSRPKVRAGGVPSAQIEPFLSVFEAEMFSL